ncbi:hypothetical protein CKO25_03170 [Thiocapsa imhoffii]|uniref:Polysaccharide biosynthesis protein n=1 Tax=Thiocapsa imhoffii TaxID=382777 RepID=A0A9X0WFN7_9GAMM|nr:oligosaccharide flippase family protein [Thiocapsa imhoffii]MBK1643676.1 hypothetical protein [Thiocapsa imhoffii]
MSERGSRQTTATRSAAETLDQSGLSRLIGRNVFSSVGAKILYLVTRFFLPPIILAYLTLEEYGIWAICFILIGYMGMGSFGVTNVYVRYVAQYHAQGEEHRIGGLLSTGLTVVSLLGALILAALWFGLPQLITAMSVSTELHETAFVLIFSTAVVYVFVMSWGAFAFVLTGLQRIVQQNQVWVVSFMLETLLIVAFLMAGFGLYGLLYAFAIRYALSILINIWLCFRYIPGLRLSFSSINRGDLALFSSYGGILQLSGFLGMFLRSIEKLIAGFFINVQATGLFDVAQKFPVMATSIPSSMNAVFLPATAYMFTQERRDELLGLYVKGARYINLLTGAMMGFMAAFAAPLLIAWLGPKPDLALAPLILACFTLPFQLNVLTGPATNIYRGMGIPARELIYPLTQLVLVVALVAAGFLQFGINVVVITLAVASAMVLSALIYMIYTNHFVGLGQWRFMRVALLPGLLPYVTGFALFFLMQPWIDAVAEDRWGSALLVLAAALAYGLLQALLTWFLQLDASEKGYVADKARGVTRRFSGKRRRPGRGAPHDP